MPVRRGKRIGVGAFFPYQNQSPLALDEALLLEAAAENQDRIFQRLALGGFEATLLKNRQAARRDKGEQQFGGCRCRGNGSGRSTGKAIAQILSPSSRFGSLGNHRGSQAEPPRSGLQKASLLAVRLDQGRLTPVAMRTGIAGNPAPEPTST